MLTLLESPSGAAQLGRCQVLGLGFDGSLVDSPEWPAGPRREEHARERMLGKTRRTRRGPASHSDAVTSPMIDGVAPPPGPLPPDSGAALS